MIGVGHAVRAEEGEEARRAAEHDRHQQQVVDRPPARPPLDPQLEVRHRPQQHRHERHEQEAQPARQEAAEERGGDAGRGGHGVAREAQLGLHRTDDVHRGEPAQRQLGGDRDRQPQRLGEPARRGHRGLEKRDHHGADAIRAARGGQPAPIGEEPVDHRTASSSSAALRVASSCSGASHARRARSTA